MSLISISYSIYLQYAILKQINKKKKEQNAKNDSGT